MTTKSPSLTSEFVDVWSDFRIPNTALESRIITSASVTTFSTSLSPGVPYILFSDGGTAYFLTNGAAPVFTPGVTNVPLPIANGEKFPLMVHSASAIKMQCTGSVYTNVTLYRAVISQSVASSLAQTEGVTT